jgi:DNA-directed RNA polymerase I, II, and III subunit RPABC2
MQRGEDEAGAAMEGVEEAVDELDVDEGPSGANDPFGILHKYHPESLLDYEEAVRASIPLQSAPAGSGADPKHTSPPFLTVFERTKILGARANMIAEGARPFVDVPSHVTSPLEIAKLELEQRRLPFIVKRPMPDGSFEYWRLSDLLILD